MYNRTILLVEDNDEIQRANKMMLELHGYIVETSMDLHAARQAVRHKPPGLIVLDIMLPEGSGLDFCREVRENSDVPILFLTALGEKDAVVRGLRAGGDDYLTKPYDYDELLARVEALLRRANPVRWQEALRIGSMEINLRSHRALLDGADLLLTNKEAIVLEVLALRHGEYIPAKELYEAVWGLDSAVDTRTVKEHIYRLRRKLEGAPVCIESARGVGYRFVLASGLKGDAE